MPESATDLSLVTTDELASEFLSRFDSVLMVYSNPGKVGPEQFVACRFNGPMTNALGLLRYATIRLNATAQAMWGDIEGDSYEGEDVD